MQLERVRSFPLLQNNMAKFSVLFSTFLLLLLLTLANSKTTPTVAPGPASPANLNLTAILEKGGQYKTLLRLLNETQVLSQIQNQLNNSFQGLTIFAPTDNAFSNLKPGTLNSLSPQEQVSLMLYHVLPRYYSMSTFESASNPVSTQGSSSSGMQYKVNITSTSNQVNVSTGVDEAVINNDLYSDFPLAVYSIDQVLLPNDLFGVKPPAAAPSPMVMPMPKKKKKGGSIPKAEGPASSDKAEGSDDKSESNGNGRFTVDLGFVVGIGILCVGYLF